MAAETRISVVIPAFERDRALEGCLRALAEQTLPASQFEVIVCDDGSRQPVQIALAPTLAELAGRLQVRIVRQDNAGPAAARNKGADATLGKYLAFTDDDCRPHPDWLERLLGHFAERPNALLGGGLRTTPGSDRYAQATQAIMDFVYDDQDRRDGVRLFSTSNLALPASGFRELGGFSSAFRSAAGEDYDLCVRWYNGGGEMRYVPDAVVSHDHALTLRAYWLQHFTYGRGLLQVRQRLRRARPRTGLSSLPGGFHLRLIASPVMRDGPRGAARAALVGLAQAATAAGVLTQLVMPDGRRRPRRSGEPS